LLLDVIIFIYPNHL